VRDGSAFAQGSAQAKGRAPRPKETAHHCRNPDPRIRAKAARNRSRDTSGQSAGWGGQQLQGATADAHLEDSRLSPAQDLTVHVETPARALLLQSCQRGQRRRFELEPLLNGSLQNLTSIKAWINPAWKRLNSHRDGGFLHDCRETIDHGVDHSFRLRDNSNRRSP
jgi:hypothetical protein